MSRLPRTAKITEVGARDGLQSETRFVATEDKIALIRAFASSGLGRIEATSFVSPRAVPQLADADTLVAAVKGLGPVIAALVPNAKGAERAVAADVDEIVVFISATESHSTANLNMSVAQALSAVAPVAEIARRGGKVLRAAIAVAFGCPFEGEVNPANVSAIAGELIRFGVRALTLGDTTGMASPPHVQKVCGWIASDHPDLRLTLHFHNTRGLGLVNVMAGLQMGIDSFESSLAGVGGCPFAPGATGNVCTEDLVYLLHELGIETGISLDGLIDAAHQMERVLGRTLPGQLMRSGPRSMLHPLSAAPRALG
jgi:hydroxymethylglutaryl-CoA lyase